jgi:hypothetical protein
MEESHMMATSLWISTAKFIGIVFLELMAVGMFVLLRVGLEERIGGMKRRWKQLTLFGITAVWAFGFTLAWDSSRNDFLRIMHWIAGVMSWGPLQVVVGLAVLAVGALAYRFKRDHQFLFGLVELPVALATAMISAGGISRSPDSFSRIATIVGCIYVVSRGLENMGKGAGGIIQSGSQSSTKHLADLTNSASELSQT